MFPSRANLLREHKSGSLSSAPPYPQTLMGLFCQGTLVCSATLQNVRFFPGKIPATYVQPIVAADFTATQQSVAVPARSVERRAYPRDYPDSLRMGRCFLKEDSPAGYTIPD
jgi:hypothetical protein